MKRFLSVFALFFFVLNTTSTAQNHSKGKISGLAFGDYYYMLRNHNSSLKDQNGFWFRRIYFTYDQPLAQNLSMRFRLEMAHPGDFNTKSTAVPFVKDAYLKYKVSSTQFLLGISPTPTFSLIEKIWGYRAVEKTPADLLKFGSSRETGLAVKGYLSSAKRFFYHAMIGNGNGQKSETNKYKKYMLALGMNLSKQWTIEAYIDYEQRSKQEKRNLLQVFAGYKGRSVRAGLQFLKQMRYFSAASDLEINLMSAFASFVMGAKVRGIFRVDKLLDPLPEGPNIAYLPISDQSAATIAIVGLDYTLQDAVHLIPNFEVVLYDESNLESDFVGRLTFFYQFK